MTDFVKVLDFGLVKSLAAEGIELTLSETTLGTLLYMSPEVVEHPNAVDARSDLYSLGAVGYFLITGEPLFNWLTLGEVLLHQVKDPASRPANARELDDALARCRNAADWTRELADEWWRKFAATQTDKTVVTPPPRAK